MRLRQRELRGLKFRRRDNARLVQIVRALLRRLRDLERRLCSAQIGGRLVVLVLHVARIDLHEQLSGLHHRADFNRDLGDLTRGLRFHFDHVDRLDRASRLSVDHDGPTIDHDVTDLRCGVLLRRATGDERAAYGRSDQCLRGRTNCGPHCEVAHS